jgi:hypothetical protein
MWLLTCAALSQVLLRAELDGEGAVRFGVPLPAAALARGLSLASPTPGAAMQWSLLHHDPDPRTGRVWVEIAIAGARERVVVEAGGAGPAGAEGGAAVAFEERVERDGARELRVRTWRWCDGGVDRIERALLLEPGSTADGAVLEAGECTTAASPDLAARRARVAIPAGFWRAARVLGADHRLGAEVREELARAAAALRTLPGERGRGDYARGAHGEVVTNLEYDTTLGFVQLALATGDPALLLRALDSARHLCDHDLDRGSGLPFRHGPDHRSARPELGHCWLRGVLLVGCTFADRTLIEEAVSIGKSLASRVVGVDAEQLHRIRDLGWPLFELEELLRFCPDPKVEAACDRLARELVARWDPACGVFRFAEGESSAESYFERLWQTAGIVLPGLRAHLARTRDRELGEIAARLERRLLELVLAGGPGLPLTCRVATDGHVFGVARRSETAAGAMLLDGLGDEALVKALRRASVRRALDGALDLDDPDLATSFSIVARCRWVTM